MVKVDLKARIQKSLFQKGIKKDLKDISLIVDQTFLEMQKELNTPDSMITIRGLGTFKNILTKKNSGINFKTKERIEIPPKRKVTFKPSTFFKK